MIKKKYYFTDCKITVEYVNHSTMKKAEEYIFKDATDIIDYKDNLENSLSNQLYRRKPDYQKL